MHEMSLAQSILDIVIRTAEQHGVRRIQRVTVKAGQLRGIVPEQLRFCFGFVAKDTVAEAAELLVNTLPIRGRCKGCSEEFFVQEFEFVCPSCESREIEVLQGMELMVENIEVADG